MREEVNMTEQFWTMDEDETALTLFALWKRRVLDKTYLSQRISDLSQRIKEERSKWGKESEEKT